MKVNILWRMYILSFINGNELLFVQMLVGLSKNPEQVFEFCLTLKRPWKWHCNILELDVSSKRF